MLRFGLKPPPTKIFFPVFSFITTLQQFKTYSTEVSDAAAPVAAEPQHAGNMMHDADI